MIEFPAVLLRPGLLFLHRVGAVRCIIEGGATPLPRMARGTAKLLGGMLAVGADEKIKPWMSAILGDARPGQVLVGKRDQIEIVGIGNAGGIFGIEHLDAFFIE